MPNPTPKLTANKKIVELTQALKVIDEMRRQNFARVDDAARKAFEQAAEAASSCMAERGLALPHRLAVIAAIRALAKEKSNGTQTTSTHGGGTDHRAVDKSRE